MFYANGYVFTHAKTSTTLNRVCPWNQKHKVQEFLKRKYACRFNKYFNAYNEQNKGILNNT